MGVPRLSSVLLPVEQDQKLCHPGSAGAQSVTVLSGIHVPRHVQGREDARRIAGLHSAAAAGDVGIHPTDSVEDVVVEGRCVAHHPVNPIRSLELEQVV